MRRLGKVQVQVRRLGKVQGLGKVQRLGKVYVSDTGYEWGLFFWLGLLSPSAEEGFPLPFQRPVHWLRHVSR